MTIFLKILFFVFDLLLLNGSILLASRLGITADNGQQQIGLVYLLMFSNISWLFLVLVSTPYNLTKGWSISKIIKGQVSFVVIHLLVVMSLFLFFRQQYTPLQIALIYLLFVPAFFGFKVFALYLRKVLTREVPVKNYILIGRNQLSSDIRRYFLLNPDERYRFKGYFDPDTTVSFASIGAFCAEHDVHEIYYCQPNATSQQLQQLIDFGLDSLIKVKLVANTMSGQRSAVLLEANEQMPGINVTTFSLDDPRNQFIKRVFDLFFSFLFLILIVSWLFPLIALVIKMDSRGPVFFVQPRSGRRNKPFKCLKFRTMIVNTDADQVQASRNDNRITRIGSFLRRTSIDELPQFLNVLVGTMSIVGPRPHMLKHTEEYSKVIDRFMGRHYVNPGITGLAQCLGYRGETRDLADMENRVKMDRYYIENWTFWLDIKIIFLTGVSLIRGSDKAY